MSASLGHQRLLEIQILGTYYRLGEGITSVTRSNNETVDTKSYMNGNGGNTSEVTGFQYKLSFSGDRVTTDTVQNYIFDRIFQMGASRSVTFRETQADGLVITGTAIFSNINPGSGDANAVQAIGFDVEFSGVPTRTEIVAATALAPTFAAGTVTGTTKATVSPSGTNTLGYRLTTAVLTQSDRQYVTNYTAYTSGANIAATAAQYLNVWEMDTYRHVVKFVSHLIDAGEIA